MLHVSQGIKDRGSSPPVTWLDQQALRREVILIGIERLVGFR